MHWINILQNAKAQTKPQKKKKKKQEVPDVKEEDNEVREIAKEDNEVHDMIIEDERQEDKSDVGNHTDKDENTERGNQELSGSEVGL